jgi:hypothetical protein
MLKLEPYPHLVISEALPPEIADALRDQFPTSEEVGTDDSKNNSRWSYGASEVNNNPRITQLWKQVVRWHTSPEFWREILTIFGSVLDVSMRDPTNRKSLSDQARVGVRGLSTFEKCDVLLEAQISGNTPVTVSSSVRRTHLDEGNKIFSGLYYLRHPDDNSLGGDFVIQRWKPWVPNYMKKNLYFEGMSDCVETVATVPYRHNTLVLLIDSFDALHAVTPRLPTSFPRRFMNLDGVLPNHEYEIPSPNLLARVRRRLGAN